MNFNLFGQIIKIEKEIKAHSKCLVKDEFSTVMMLIPTELLNDISIGDEVEIWGQLKGYGYNDKIYNNLFAKGVIKLSNKFLLLKYVDNSTFNIIKYSSSPIIAEEKEEEIQPEENLSSGDLNLNNIFKIIKKQSILIANTYSSHIEKALKENLITKKNEIIHLNDNTSYFTKVIDESPFIFFVKRGIFFSFEESLIHEDL